MQYHQFCPIAKATEILGEKWTILILREVLMGGRRFNVIQRGLGDISPALLTARLKSLEVDGLILKRKISGQRGFEYYPTAACEELQPVILALGEWGLCHARHTILDEDFDVDFLMLYLERSVDPSKLVGDVTVVKFHFTDLKEQSDYWLMIEGDRVELCLKDPGRDVDVYFSSTVRTLSDVWMGDRTYREAIKAGDLDIQGIAALTRNVSAWLRPSIYVDAPRAPMPPQASSGEVIQLRP
ncbi:MAG: transcriptional regulator [Alphaproteobacteria bacterium]|nr:MAG: transcriptional regulator [Alphaproteobacteria bacterium]